MLLRIVTCFVVAMNLLICFSVRVRSQSPPNGPIPRTVIASDRHVDAPQIVYNGKEYPLYPKQLESMPEIPSPLFHQDGREFLTVITIDDKYIIIPVTIENGDPYVKEGRLLFGKGNQRTIHSQDFPTLARTGLHSESELDRAKTITGRSIAEINELARPGRSSSAGFISEDEDIISVLKADNRLVQTMKLTHPELAQPLFHTWNLILQEYRLGRISGRMMTQFQCILYNGNRVVIKAQGSRGYQDSIFNDEILGNAQMEISRSLTSREEQLLRQSYEYLAQDQMAEMRDKLSHIHTGEMVPYYIGRYGFYEGHTSYRADPVALAFIYGLKSLEELEKAFEGNLYQVLTGNISKQKN